MRDRGLPQPSQLVLMSPFLDATMTDGRQEAISIVLGSASN